MSSAASLSRSALFPIDARMPARLRALAAAGLLALLASGPLAARVPSAQALDAQAAKAMAATQARGLAIAVVDRGRVVRVRSYGNRNAQGQPLRTDTVMYG